MGRRLTPAMINVLLALGSEEKHGYAIMTQLEELGGASMRIGPATLYRSLAALAQAGLIEESEERPDPESDDERRRYYRLTPRGQAVASAEAERLDSLLASARRSGLLPGRRSSTGLAGAD